jgi:small subunit ribosomal protein S3
MGQKTHPLGFRLGITKNYKSNWYSNFNEYANILKEDDTIRSYFESLSKSNKIANIYRKEDDTIRSYFENLSKSNKIANICIHRNGLNETMELTIETGDPGILVDKKGIGFEKLVTKLKLLTNTKKELRIKICEIEKVDLNAQLLADFVAEQLKKRIAFRKAIREALQKAQKQNVNGIKIQVSGRLNGAEIARSEWIREGRVPLQTLRADIDYATKEAHTIYGVLGIKVWVFKSEILSK